MANKDIREKAKNNGVALWEIANFLKISEPTMTRRMRTEIAESDKQMYFDAITSIVNARK